MSLRSVFAAIGLAITAIVLIGGACIIVNLTVEFVTYVNHRFFCGITMRNGSPPPPHRTIPIVLTPITIVNDPLREALAALQERDAEIARLREALEFYAEPSSYLVDNYDCDTVSGRYGISERARKALGK